MKDVHKIIHNTLRVTLESSDSLKQILPIDSIKLSSERDRNLKEILAPAMPHAHRQKRKEKGACSKCYNQRCGLCKIGICISDRVILKAVTQKLPEKDSNTRQNCRCRRRRQFGKHSKLSHSVSA